MSAASGQSHRRYRTRRGSQQTWHSVPVNRSSVARLAEAQNLAMTARDLSDVPPPIVSILISHQSVQARAFCDRASEDSGDCHTSSRQVPSATRLVFLDLEACEPDQRTALTGRCALLVLSFFTLGLSVCNSTSEGLLRSEFARRLSPMHLNWG